MAESQTTSSELHGRRRDHDAPDRPTELPRTAWSGVLRRTLREFQADHLTDLAAALTYYGVLAIFPMLIVIVSIVGLMGRSVTQPLVANLNDLHRRQHRVRALTLETSEEFGHCVWSRGPRREFDLDERRDA